jgi:hypothetical protein
MGWCLVKYKVKFALKTQHIRVFIWLSNSPFPYVTAVDMVSKQQHLSGQITFSYFLLQHKDGNLNISNVNPLISQSSSILEFI